MNSENSNIESLPLRNDLGNASNPQALATPPSKLRRTFFGADGLRAGWSLLIFFALIAGLFFVIGFIAHRLLKPSEVPGAGNPISLRFGFISEVLPFLAVLLVTWVMSKIEHRRNSVYGFGDSRPVQHFFAGLGWGLVCLSLLVGILWKAGLLVFDSRLLFGAEILKYGVLWLLMFFFVGLLEEYLTRGFLLFTLARGLAGIYWWIFKTRHSNALGFWTGTVILSILFGLGHGSNPGESPIGLFAAGLAGFVFCLSLWRTGSLWWAIGIHTSWDWAQSFLYGVADSGYMAQHRLLATHPVGKPILSGGTTGPEGSIVILAIMAFIVLIILFTLPRTGESYAAKLPAQRIEA